MAKKWGKVGKSGGKWRKVAESGGKWGNVVKSGNKWRIVGKSVEKWVEVGKSWEKLKVAKSGSMWLKVVVCGSKWLNMGTIGLFGPIPLSTSLRYLFCEPLLSHEKQCLKHFLTRFPIFCALLDVFILSFHPECEITIARTSWVSKWGVWFRV